jgi:dimethylglycine dehydrogenase
MNARQVTGPRELLTVFEVDASEADAWGDEPVYRGDELVGYISSGGYGAATDKSLALGYLRADAVDASVEYAIEILGERRASIVHPKPVYDPAGERMRA